MFQLILVEPVTEESELIWDDIVTPVNLLVFEELLVHSNFTPGKISALVKQFKEGFDLGYRGLLQRKNLSENIPLKPGIGNVTDWWNKVMKEVKAHRYAGPYLTPPFKHFVQSPVGLVPKARNKTRLIFHLSFDFSDKWEDKSVNFHTPSELCSVKYNDLDHAIRTSLNMLKKFEKSQLFYAKSDFSNAFRILPGKIEHRFLLVM